MFKRSVDNKTWLTICLLLMVTLVVCGGGGGSTSSKEIQVHLGQPNLGDMMDSLPVELEKPLELENPVERENFNYRPASCMSHTHTVPRAGKRLGQTCHVVFQSGL